MNAVDVTAPPRNGRRITQDEDHGDTAPNRTGRAHGRDAPKRITPCGGVRLMTLTYAAPGARTSLTNAHAGADSRSRDAVLLHRIRVRDSDALRELHDTYAALVVAIARKVMADNDAAHDIAQVVFLHLWTHADRVDLERGSLPSYLVVVARRRSIDFARSEQCRREREHRHANAEARLADHGIIDTTDAETAKQRQVRLALAVALLPSNQRIALELAFFGGRTYPQVATELDIPLGTAKSRIRRALSRLHDLTNEIDAPDPRLPTRASGTDEE
jgi:RNA polymerase sigma-70 factor (ECF subfamily)